MRVSTVHVRALVEAYEWYGKPAQSLFDAVGFAMESLAPGYGFVTVAELDALTVTALSLTGDAAFGLRWGERSSMAQFDLASLMVGAAPTLRSGLDSLLPFQRILGDRPELFFEEEGGRARFLFEPMALNAEAQRVRADLAVSAFWRMLEASDGAVLAHSHAHFRHARPAYQSEYARLFSDRVHFAADHTGIDFPSEVLDRPRLRSPSVYRALAVEADSVRSRVLAGDSYRERIRQHVMLALPRVPEMPAAANAVGISERSLRRRLELEGSSYVQLVEEAKLARSRELLADFERPIKEVATQLGFSEVSSFHRAFKRWTGLTPVAYRAQS